MARARELSCMLLVAHSGPFFCPLPLQASATRWQKYVQILIPAHAEATSHVENPTTSEAAMAMSALPFACWCVVALRASTVQHSTTGVVCKVLNYLSRLCRPAAARASSCSRCAFANVRTLLRKHHRIEPCAVTASDSATRQQHDVVVVLAR